MHANNTNYDWATVYNKANRTDVERYLSKEPSENCGYGPKLTRSQAAEQARSRRWPRTSAWW